MVRRRRRRINLDAKVLPKQTPIWHLEWRGECGRRLREAIQLEEEGSRKCQKSLVDVSAARFGIQPRVSRFLRRCHCKNCQKQTGTSFSVISVPSLALSVKGTLKTFDDTGDGEKPVHRNFCRDCGSPVTSIMEARPGLSFIKAGTLDDASWLKPTVEIWCGSAQPWVSLVGDRQKCAKAPG
jgi:hypothetical protein